MNTSNIERYIERKIENKINQFFEILPQSNNVEIPKMIHDYTILELYEGTIQTIVNIINDLTELGSNKSYMSTREYQQKLFFILFANERKLFLGILLVILSLILYFIDGSSI